MQQQFQHGAVSVNGVRNSTKKKQLKRRTGEFDEKEKEKYGEFDEKEEEAINATKNEYGAEEEANAIKNEYGAEKETNYLKNGLYNRIIDIGVFFIFDFKKVSPYPRSKTMCRGYKGDKNTSLWFQDYMPGLNKV